MSEWVLVPSLVGLRTEFNTISPQRDKGADGSIGDSNHNSSSDHSPDEDSAILRDHDADAKNEVHALDIDSSGPWPGEGKQFQRFDRIVKRIIARERARWLDPNDMCRLNYVIWDRRIYDKDADFEPRDYINKPDPHTNHAHFSSRYETRAENDTSGWGVTDDGSNDVALNDDMITLTADTAKEIGRKAGDKVTAATLLQLAVIFAARSDDKADAAQEAATLATQQGTEIVTRLGRLESAVGQVDEETAGRIFNGNNDQLAGVWLAALGPERAKAVAELVLNRPV